MTGRPTAGRFCGTQYLDPTPSPLAASHFVPITARGAALLLSLAAIGAVVSISMHAGIWKDLLLVACGMALGLIVLRSKVQISLSAAVEQERVLRNRLSVAMKAAGNG